MNLILVFLAITFGIISWTTSDYETEFVCRILFIVFLLILALKYLFKSNSSGYSSSSYSSGDSSWFSDWSSSDGDCGDSGGDD